MFSSHQVQDAIAVSLAQNNGGELLPSPDCRDQGISCSSPHERELIHTSIVNISTIDNRTVSPFIDDSTPTPSPTSQHSQHRVTNITSPIENRCGLDQQSTTVTTGATDTSLYSRKSSNQATKTNSELHVEV